MKTLKAVEIITTLSICYSGASIQRQVTERRVTLPDNLFWLILLITGYIYTLLCRAWDWLFVGWIDDLRLMSEAVRLLFVPRKLAYGTIYT